MEQQLSDSSSSALGKASVPRQVTGVATGVAMERSAASTIIANPSKPPDMQIHSKAPKAPINKSGGREKGEVENKNEKGKKQVRSCSNISQEPRIKHRSSKFRTKAFSIFH